MLEVAVEHARLFCWVNPTPPDTSLPRVVWRSARAAVKSTPRPLSTPSGSDCAYRKLDISKEGEGR